MILDLSFIGTYIYWSGCVWKCVHRWDNIHIILNQWLHLGRWNWTHYFSHLHWYTAQFHHFSPISGDVQFSLPNQLTWKFISSLREPHNIKLAILSIFCTQRLFRHSVFGKTTRNHIENSSQPFSLEYPSTILLLDKIF